MKNRAIRSIKMIGEVDEAAVPREVFEQLLKKIYKRKL